MRTEEKDCIIEHTDIETITIPHIVYMSAKEKGQKYSNDSNAVSKTIITFHMIGDMSVKIRLPHEGLNEYIDEINRMIKAKKQLIILQELQETVIESMSKQAKV